MNTCIHRQEPKLRAGLKGASATAMLFALSLCGCVTAVPIPAPMGQVAPQWLVQEGPIGEHLLVDANSPQARALMASHGAHPVRVTPPVMGVVTLNNVSIPLSLGGGIPPALVPPSANVSEEPRP